MEVDILALPRTAHLFSGALSKLYARDGWFLFESDFAKFAIEQKINWAHFAPMQLAGTAQRIEQTWEVVDNNSTISLRS